LNWRTERLKNFSACVAHRTDKLAGPIIRRILGNREHERRETDGETAPIVSICAPLAQIISTAAKASNKELKRRLKICVLEHVGEGFNECFNSSISAQRNFVCYEVRQFDAVD